MANTRRDTFTSGYSTVPTYKPPATTPPTQTRGSGGRGWGGKAAPSSVGGFQWPAWVNFDQIGAPSGLGGGSIVPNFNTPAAIAAQQATFQARRAQGGFNLPAWIHSLNFDQIGTPNGLGGDVVIPNFNPVPGRQRAFGALTNQQTGPGYLPGGIPGGGSYDQTSKTYTAPNGQTYPLDDKGQPYVPVYQPPPQPAADIYLPRGEARIDYGLLTPVGMPNLPLWKGMLPEQPASTYDTGGSSYKRYGERRGGGGGGSSAYQRYLDQLNLTQWQIG